VAISLEYFNSPLGHSEEARTAITTALALHEELPSAWFEKGRLDLDAYEFEEASGACGKVIELAGESQADLKQQADGLATIAKNTRQLKPSPMKDCCPSGISR
jgi:predicted TPR repeat methyltransferase